MIHVSMIGLAPRAFRVEGLEGIQPCCLYIRSDKDELQIFMEREELIDLRGTIDRALQGST